MDYIYYQTLIIYNPILKFVGFTLAARATPLRLALRPCGLRYALAACATPSLLGLCPRGSRYALGARATPLLLGLCPRGLRYALAARATPSRLGFALAGHATCLRLGLRRRWQWRRQQWKRRQRMLVLAACATHSQARASPSRLGFARFALAARTPRLRLGSPKHNNQTAKQRPQKLLRQRCRLSAEAVAAGGISAGCCGGIGCGSVGGSVSVSSNGGGGGSGSSGRR